MAGNRDSITCGNILANQDSACPGLQINRPLLRVDGMSHSYGAGFRGDIYILVHIHIRAKDNTSLFTDCGCKSLFGTEFIRDIDIAIAPIEINAATRLNQAIIFDDEVAILCSFSIHILSCFHADIASLCNRTAFYGNRASFGSYADILFRNKRFLIRHIVTAYSNIALARFQLNAFIRRFYPLDNGNIALPCTYGDITLRCYRFFVPPVRKQ